LEVHSTGLLIGDLQRWAGPQGARLRSSNIPILETCAASYLQGGIPGVLEGSPPQFKVNSWRSTARGCWLETCSAGLDPKGLDSVVLISPY